MSSTRKVKSLSFNRAKKTSMRSLPGNLKKSKKNFKFELCKIKQDNITTIIFDQIDLKLEELLKKHSSFCKNKNVSLIKYISSGAFGKVFEMEINGKRYAVKVQKAATIFNRNIYYKDLEKEVFIGYKCKGIKRNSDGENIGIEIYDCFYICNNNRLRCNGFFIFIMDLGKYSGYKFIENYDEWKLVRQHYNQSYENIKLSVTKKNLYCIDHKPYNMIVMEKTDTNGNKKYDTKLIDFSPSHCRGSISDFIDVKKLNNCLRTIETKKPGKSGFILNSKGKLSKNKLGEIFYTIQQLQYFIVSFPLLEKKKWVKILFKNDDSKNINREMFDKIFSVNAKEWLSVSISLILGTDKVNIGNTENLIKIVFYYYLFPNMNIDIRTVSLKDQAQMFNSIFYKNIKNIYKDGLQKLGQQDLISKIDYIYNNNLGNKLSKRFKNLITFKSRNRNRNNSGTSNNQYLSNESSNHKSEDFYEVKSNNFKPENENNYVIINDN